MDAVSGFVENGILEMNQAIVRNRYLQSYFLLDVLSSFPTEMLYHIITKCRSESLNQLSMYNAERSVSVIC